MSTAKSSILQLAMPIAEALTLTGWVVSPILKELISTVKSAGESKYRSFKDFKKQLVQLVAILEQLQDTVKIVQTMSDSNMMLSQLIDAIHEVQDIFDELDYRKTVLERMSKARKIAHSTVNTGRRIIGMDKTFSRLKELMVELSTIQQLARDVVRLKQLQASSSGQNRESKSAVGPLPSQDKLFGYSEKYDDLRSALLNDRPTSSSRGSGRANVIAVIGHSGLGKTAIAQQVYSDDKITTVFSPRIWVSVSGKFSKEELLAEIWKSVSVDNKPSGELMSFGVLQQKLRELVTSRRYLLVLDDVCNDESDDDHQQKKRTWVDVLAPFKFGTQGSRILITTQANVCSKTLNAGTKIQLNGIGTDDLVLLLKKCAFQDEHKQYPQLEEVLRRAAEKLKGSPSAAKAFVDMVTNKHRMNEWEEALKNDCFLTSGDRPRYRCLPQHLKQCLAFCSIFPVNWEFEPESLVKLWITHGLISDTDNKNCRLDWKGMQDVGRKYIKALQSNSLLQSTKHGKTIYFVIDEQIHSMLLSSSANNSFFRIDNNNTGSIPQNVRYLSVTKGCMAQLKNDPVLKKLRTLLVFDDKSSPLHEFDIDVLKQIKKVRVLDLSGSSITGLPEAIGELKHLRYLGLPKTIKQLSAAVTKLLHLQTLRVVEECTIDDFPSDGMNRLVNLRHLDVDTSNIAAIGGIGKLGKLQGSVEFCAAMGQGHGMEELAGMNSLQGTLSIKGLHVVANKEEAQKAQLQRKEFVKALKFEWEATLEDTSVSHEQVLEGLQPHCNIEEMHIRRYQGTSSPSWLECSLLVKLRYICLTNCWNWTVLPQLAQLPRLKVVHIKELSSISRIDDRFYGSRVFQSLEKIVLDDMQNLVEWTAESTDVIFPVLQEIIIINCPKLEKLPQVPSSVKTMTIKKCNSSYLTLSYSSKLKSYSLEISGDAVHLLREDFLHQDHIKAISSLNIVQYNGSSEPNINHLAFVRSLSFSRCVLTEWQLSMYLQRLRSLERLKIVDCSEFEAFPHDAMISSLKSFEIKRCHPVLMKSLRDRTGPIWTKICSIPRLHID